MWVLLKFVRWEGLELVPADGTLPVPAAIRCNPEDPSIGFLPVYLTRAEAEAQGENGHYRVTQIQERDDR